MKIVLLESLGIAEKELDQFAQKLKAEGHEFCAYEKNTDEDVQIERAKDADVIMIANMPLSGKVIRSCPSLKYIDVAWKQPKKERLRSAMHPDIPMNRLRNCLCA